MSVYTTMIRPLLFRLDAERAHQMTVEGCCVLGAIPGVAALTRGILKTNDPILHIEVAGLRFNNPIGLAAGWDKSGRALTMLDSLGFGFAEIGSVSARSSLGNPKPRLFRLPQDRAIIVNYGLPNDGAEVVSARLAAHHPQRPLGVNIVKTHDGQNAPPCGTEEILADYQRSVSLIHRHASYLMLNLSCPNVTAGGDFFVQPGNIRLLLERLQPLGVSCPVFLKVAPRDDAAMHQRLLSQCEGFAFVHGFCFNLPSGKPDSLNLNTSRETLADRPGAVAGRPVTELINRCIAGLYMHMDRQRYVIIGTGGVFTGQDAYEKIRLGASLVQLYTAMIYEGPGVTKRICRGLGTLLRRDGFQNVAEAVGSGHTGAGNA
jgi:dihydroorotate dehydrogenase